MDEVRAILGVDIAKSSFTVTLLDEAGYKQRGEWHNTEKGFERLVRWLKQQNNCQAGEVHVCMESTSVYWEELAEHLHAAGYRVSVVNPRRIKGYAMSQMRRSKTDALDGDVIADFCRTQQPACWTPPTPEEKKLRALVRHRYALQKSRTQQTNRLATCRDEEVRASLRTLIAAIDAELEKMQASIKQFFDEHPDLRRKKELLGSIKGIGEKTAIYLLAEMYDLALYKDAKAAAADVGVTASHYRSGVSVRRRSKMSRMGKASIRGALHWPAITAIQHNPLVRDLAQRLQAKGKHSGTIQVAAMRKLIHIAHGVLKSGQPFDPAYAR